MYCMYTFPLIVYKFSEGEGFLEIVGLVQYYNSAFLMYCIYTFPRISPKPLYDERVWGN